MSIAHTRRPHPAFGELDVVRTRAAIRVDGRILPSGTVGVIVIVHLDGAAVDVEFAEPAGTVVTLEVSDVEPG